MITWMGDLFRKIVPADRNEPSFRAQAWRESKSRPNEKQWMFLKPPLPM